MIDLANTDVQSGADTSGADTTAAVSEDNALGALFDQAMDDGGPARDASGRFASKSPTEAVEPATGDDASEQADSPNTEVGEIADGAEQARPADGAGVSKGAALPPNWNGMEEAWAKIPPDVQAKIATRDAELHGRMSEQGRQISGFRPFMEIVGRNKDLFEGKTMPDGRAITPEFAVDYLMGIQRRMDDDPLRTMIDIADSFGLRDGLAAVLAGHAQLPPQKHSQAAGLLPADVQGMIERAMAERSQETEAEAELSRLTKDKPLYADISEVDMVHSIQKARTKLGQTASPEAVFNLAYDIAVNADPDLRKKVTAAVKPAAAPRPDTRAADARRANDVNVISRQTGKAREQTEDELLAAAFDAAYEKD